MKKIKMCCSFCGKVVSNYTENDLIFRAVAVCPECFEKEFDNFEKKETVVSTKFKVGDKVVPVSKTADGRTKELKSSASWLKALKEGKTYLVVETAPYPDDYQEYRCNGDYFHENDLISYKEILKTNFK